MSMTMKKIAEMAGVSRFAVSSVLNNSNSTRVSEKTRKKVLKLVEKYNFVPSSAARQLRGGSSTLVGLISVPSHRGLVSIFQSKVISILQAHGFEVITANMGSSSEQQKVIREFQAHRVKGIMGIGMERKMIQQKSDPIPIVYCFHSSSLGFDVGCDLEMGGYLAAKHLLRHGRRKLMYFGLHEMDTANKLKYKGVCDALREAGLEAGSDSLLISDGNAVDIVAQIKKRRGDALVCCNDFAAAELLRVFQQNGIRVPDDLAMTGFDGYFFCEYTHVPLATVLQPVPEIAEYAVNLLLERIQNNFVTDEFSNIKLPPVFLPGPSCGCRRPEKKIVSADAYTLMTDRPLTLPG